MRNSLWSVLVKKGKKSRKRRRIPHIRHKNRTISIEMVDWQSQTNRHEAKKYVYIYISKEVVTFICTCCLSACRFYSLFPFMMPRSCDLISLWQTDTMTTTTSVTAVCFCCFCLSRLLPLLLLLLLMLLVLMLVVLFVSFRTEHHLHICYISICTQINSIDKFQFIFFFLPFLYEYMFNILYGLFFSTQLWMHIFLSFVWPFYSVVCHFSSFLSFTLYFPCNHISKKMIEIAVKQLPDYAISLIDFHVLFSISIFARQFWLKVKRTYHVAQITCTHHRRKINGISSELLCVFFFLSSSVHSCHI